MNSRMPTARHRKGLPRWLTGRGLAADASSVTSKTRSAAAGRSFPALAMPSDSDGAGLSPPDRASPRCGGQQPSFVAHAVRPDSILKFAADASELRFRIFMAAGEGWLRRVSP